MPLHPVIAGRFSARGFDSDTTISDEQLDVILEAARWAPTWGKSQPVRFIVGKRGDTTFEALAGDLTAGNIAWASRAAALILVCTRDIPDDETMQTYGAVDLGLALSQLILQAVADGFSAHPMAGFNASATFERFSIPAGERPLVMVAIGTLMPDDQKEPEIADYDNRQRFRRPLTEVAFTERWGHSLHPAAHRPPSR